MRRIGVKQCFLNLAGFCTPGLIAATLIIQDLGGVKQASPQQKVGKGSQGSIAR